MAKYRITPSSRTIVQSPVSIGHKAEKGVEAIEFDVTAWVETYGSGTLTVIMRRWGDAIPYPIALEIDENNKATWTLSDTDTAKAGMAYAQLSYIVGETVVKKSDIYTFRVMDSLTGEGEPPEAYESWLEHLTHLAAEAMAEVLDIEGIVTDKTLSIEGGIADAKATGEALAKKVDAADYSELSDRVGRNTIALAEKADRSTTYTKAQVNQMIEDVEVETDTTLAISGAPADAAETGRQIGLIKADLANFANSVVLTRPNAGTREIAMDIAIGDVIKITTSGANGCQVRLKATSGGENLQVLSVTANSVGYMTAVVNASYVSVYFGGAISVTLDVGRISTLEANVDKALKDADNVFPTLILEQGGITINGEYTDFSTRLRTANTLQGEFFCHCPNGFRVYYAYFFDANGYIVSSTSLNVQYAKVTVPSGTFCKLSFCKDDASANITIEEIKASYVLEEFNKRLNTVEYPPMVVFDADYNLDADVATVVADKGYTKGSTAMQNIYSYFDSLVDNSYVTKVDLASELDINYPRYANGVESGDATYLETPAYKTYMYKLICSNSYINTSYQKKRKVIILGGVHGDEQASPFNLYLFAKKLCDGYLTNPNFFKLRSAFDFYIVPCVNGYGMIHETRTNANHININRNFPIHSWSKTASGENYSGETAGSEFETQLVMALINSVKPDMFIDHHNYTYNMNTQFYVDVFDKKQLKLVYQSLADLSYVFKKNYPAYFGDSFDFVKSNGGCPGSMGEIYGSTSRWAFEQLTPFSATIEIADCITYLNGAHANARQDYYGADTFKVGEYTLRNQILRYGQWVLENS